MMMDEVRTSVKTYDELAARFAKNGELMGQPVLDMRLAKSNSFVPFTGTEQEELNVKLQKFCVAMQDEMEAIADLFEPV